MPGAKAGKESFSVNILIYLVYSDILKKSLNLKYTCIDYQT